MFPTTSNWSRPQPTRASASPSTVTRWPQPRPRSRPTPPPRKPSARSSASATATERPLHRRSCWKLRAALADAFSCAAEAIRLNDPFRGGHITRAHGGGSLPWIQVEMNRSLYLAEPWFDRRTRTLDPARSEDLRTRFLAALHALFP